MLRDLLRYLFKGGVPFLIAALPAALLAQEKPRQADPALIQRIFTCMQEGLPETWQRTWVIVTELPRKDAEREFRVVFRYANSAEDLRGETLTPCDAASTPKDLYELDPDLMRQYGEATLVFYRDGKFELRFDKPK